MKIIVRYLYQMLPFVILSIPVFFVIRLLIWRQMKRSYPLNFLHETVFLLFVMFLSGLASITAIPELEWGMEGLRITNPGGGGINHIPFVVFYDVWIEYFDRNNISYFFINFLGNIVMFLPVGFCFPLLWNQMPLKKVILIGFGCSLFIEICQLPVARGTDVDDLWLNTLGTLLGFWMYHLAASRWPEFVGRFRPFKVKEKV